MKRILIIALSFLLLLSVVKPVEAGISLGKGAIMLKAGESGEMCDVWIYASQEGGTYQVSTTGDLVPLTTGVTPNDFALDPIDCPREEGTRRACIADTCLSGNGSSCKIVCVQFTAPMLIEWEPEEVIYSGAILNNIRISAAAISEPFAFSVHVNPMDMKPLVTGIAVAVIVIVAVLILFVKKRKR